MSKKRAAAKPKKSTAGKENAEFVQYDTTEKVGREDSKSGERSEREQHENLERDLTYAKSEIGRLALRFLKNTSLPQRIAGVVLVVVLSLGVGVAVGIYQLPPSITSGFGLFEEKDDEVVEDENATDKEDENATDKDDTVTESDSESADDKPVVSRSKLEQYLASMPQASFTKGQDGIYRAHIEAENFIDDWTLADKYAFDIPAELRKPTEPYVMHMHTQRHGLGRYGGEVSIIYSHGDDLYENDSLFSDFNLRPYNPEEAASDTHDFFLPFIHKNDRVDDEFAMITSESRALDIDIELWPASQVQPRAWDGHSPLEQSDSELFRVTGPITASQFGRTDFHSVVFYGWRPGDTAFYPITQFGEQNGDTSKTINLSELDANTLNGVQLLWVDNEYRHSNVWSIQ
ncbi:MAG: hypothetical protein IKS49_00240 [Actinomycetaceae bacterium]|nr:hypothetical protein [Actinomycetaceae bacterium]